MLKSWKTAIPRLLLAAALLLPVLPLSSVSAAASLDITSYGAAGNDTADDLAAIHSAIAAAAAGDKVYFPAGTYYVSGPIKAKTGIKLTGASRDSAIIKFAGTADNPVILLSGAADVEVSELTVDGNGNSFAKGGIWGEPANGSKIHHNRIINLTKSSGFGPFGILFSGSSNVEITDNEIRDIGVKSEWGGAIRAGWGSHNAKILRNTIANTGRGGIFLNDGSTGGVIRENTVTGSGLFSKGLSIELHTRVNNSLVEDNVVDHWISVVISDNNAIRRNTVRPTDGRYKSYGLEISSGNSIVTDNLVDGGQHLGISSSPSREYTFYGYNTIRNMAQWGLQLQGNNVVASNSQQYFYKNQFLDTQKDHPLAWYPDYAGYGVRLHGYSTNITFDSNVISGNERYGIDITGAPGIDKISFLNNTITDNGLDTYDYYPDSSANLEWSGNTVLNNGLNREPVSRGFANAKPAVDFTAPVGAVVGQPVTFTDASTDSDGTIVHYLWDLGEGLPVTTPSATYAYGKPGAYRVTLMATDDGGRTSIKERTVVIVADGNSLPLDWQKQAYDGGEGGSASYAADTGTYTLNGYYNVYRPLSGDGEIVARLAAVPDGAGNANAKPAVVIRDGLSDDAAAAVLSFSPGGRKQHAPVWLKLVRTGDTFTGYTSADGAEWTLESTATVPMGAQVYAGLAGLSKNQSVHNTAVFDQVTVTP